MGHKVSVVTANDNLQNMSAGQQVTCSKPAGSTQKKKSVPRGRSNSSISHKLYTSMLPLKNIKDI